MHSSAIYSKLKQIFPRQLQTFSHSQISSNFMDQSHVLSFIISSTLPHLSLQQIHTLGRKQQKNVIDRIQQVKHIDLYRQIATVCPSQKDLRNMPTEQCISKINQFTVKMALQEKIHQFSDEDEMIDYSEFSSVAVSQSVQMMAQPMQIHQIHSHQIISMKGINNIFESEYNSDSHLAWNQICSYDFN